MILCIDTKDQKNVIVSLRQAQGGKTVATLTEENKLGSQVLLPLIDKLLQAASCKLQDLKGIEVETGPGSFTGLRVGVSVGNALGFSLNIPVNGKKTETKLLYS